MLRGKPALAAAIVIGLCAIILGARWLSRFIDHSTRESVQSGDELSAGLEYYRQNGVLPPGRIKPTGIVRPDGYVPPPPVGFKDSRPDAPLAKAPKPAPEVLPPLKGPLDKNASALLEQARAKVQLGDPEGAAETYDQLLEDYPRSLEAQLARRERAVLDGGTASP